MEITINQQRHQFKSGCSVAQMLEKIISEEPKGIAVAINQTIIQKSLWQDYLLRDGDEVMLIKATQGG
ncbi:MAG: sulfur carrier protein ThiS [Bacteroidota bacterium]